ncbi:MAG: hypothetical protein JKY87_02485 [Mariprofundus sp.]|nr:hypothetical protein [Mariprofundus sp.]
MSELFTVAKLIEALKEFPAETPVVVSGYESGYENIMPPKMIKLQHQKENKYWDGEFQEAEQEDKHVFDAIVLNRVIRHD